MNEQTIWEKQEKLRQWHEAEYIKEFPDSRFNTGRTLAETSGTDYDSLTDEEKERKERVAHLLNTMLFSLGINVSGAFRDEESEVDDDE